MDRGLNLEALTEEDDEESWERSDESSGEEGEAGFQSGEPNQFDNLCDGVLTCMALIHASLGEMLDLKNELLRHSLPPSVLTRSVLVTSKVFRSFNDMHVPIGELIRMVRLYSTPWEEKSTALKKLHDDYEGKKTQLHIAIKRLEFVDVNSKRIGCERRVMNWEKLFAKLTAAKGHGRRWKFLIDAFKKRACLGMEELQVYLDSMDASSSEDEGEEEEEEEGTEVATQMQHVVMGSPSLNQEEEEDEASSESESSSEEDEEENNTHKEFETQSEVSSVPQQQRHEEEEVRKTVIIKPPMKDAMVMAGEPEFDRELHIRVFEPEGLDCRELKCVLNLGDMIWKTDVLDMNQKQVNEDPKAMPPKEEVKPPMTPKRGGRGRGMIGSRGSRVSPSKTPTLQMVPLPENEEDVTEAAQQTEKKFFEESIFALPEDIPKGQYIPRGQSKTVPPKHLRVAVHFGPREEIVAMATIHMSDLLDLELPTIVLGPPVGDVFDVEKAKDAERERSKKVVHMVTLENAISEVKRANTELSKTPSGDNADDSLLQEAVEEAKEKPEEPSKPNPKPKLYDAKTEKFVNEQLRDQKPFDFPLYSIHSGKSDVVHIPCGKLPLLCFWVKNEVPRKLCKMTESASVNELVLEMTGIDLNVTTKEDINKEMQDEALSTISFTPELPSEETVTRSEYDQLMSTHNEEMEMMQNEYEQRIQELLDTIQHLQETQMEMSALATLPKAMVGDPNPLSTYSQSPARSHTSQQVPAHYDSPFEEQVYTRYSTVQGTRPPSNKHTETDLPLYMQASRNQQAHVGKALPKWGKNLSADFFERLQQFEELSQQKHAELREQIIAAMRRDIERKMASQYRLAQQNEEGLFDAIQDVSLPAVFLPSQSTNMHIFNPRAHKYFHPTGTGGSRLSQPPSMLMLPPLPKSKMSVLNLFDVSQNFQRDGPDWLMQRYLSATEQTAAQHQQEPAPPPNVHSAHQPQQGPDSPLKPHSATHSLHSQPPSPAKSAARSRQPGSSSSKFRRSVASGRTSQRVAPAPSPAHHQVTLPGNTPQCPLSRISSAGANRQQQVSPAGMGSRMSTQSISPDDYVPPRSAMTLSVTPGMLKSPNPVGQQEAGLIAPMPGMLLIENGTPT